MKSTLRHGLSTAQLTPTAQQVMPRDAAHDRPDDSTPTSRARPWRRSVLAKAALGSVLLLAALPPLAWGWLGWFAPIPWLLLIAQPSLEGRRPFVQLWLAGSLFWILAVHWLRLPHPATPVGWVAVAAYLGCYLPAFVAAARIAVHRLGIPLLIAAPVAWTGCELARAHVLTGFLMGSLAHTQVRWPMVIQVSDLAGEYAVDFIMVLVAAALAGCWNTRPVISHGKSVNARHDTTRSGRLHINARGIAVALAVLAGTLAYGAWRLGEETIRGGPRVALIQGHSLADWKNDAAKQRRIMDEYVGLSERAVAEARATGEGRPLDLIVWPETMFRSSLVEFSPSYAASVHAQLWQKNHHRPLSQITDERRQEIASLVNLVQTPVLVGVDFRHYDVDQQGEPLMQSYNVAVMASLSGQIVGHYRKVHLVMFGEYIPFRDWIPWLARLAPVAGNSRSGDGPVALPLDDVVYSPNICYESVLPHVIRRQVRELSAQGNPPDVLVNLTNDAWYWGSSELDMHLACDVFRAVETRTPHLVAANGGLSVHIDSCGRVVKRLPRQTPGIIIADVAIDERVSFYARTGDWFAGICLACCVIVGIVTLGNRFQRS